MTLSLGVIEHALSKVGERTIGEQLEASGVDEEMLTAICEACALQVLEGIPAAATILHRLERAELQALTSWVATSTSQGFLIALAAARVELGEPPA